MRRSIRVERHLAAPPESVFEILADHAHYDRFDGIRRSQLVKEGSPDANGLGAVRWIWLGPLRFQEEVTAYEAPSRLDYRITDVKGLPFSHEGGSIRLEPDGTGTHALWTSVFEIPIRSWEGRSTASSPRSSRKASAGPSSEAPSCRPSRHPPAARASRPSFAAIRHFSALRPCAPA